MTDYTRQYQQNQEESFDVKKLLFKILRRWYWFVLSVGIAYGAAWLINYYTSPKYSISATLIINEEKKSTAELLVSVLDRYSPRKNVDNEITILKSYSIAAKTLDKLNFGVSYYIVGRVRETQMYRNLPFTIIPDSASNNMRVNIDFLPGNRYQVNIGENFTETLSIGEKCQHPAISFMVKLNVANTDELVGSKYFFTVNNFNSLVNQYRGKINIAPNEKRGTVLTLSLSGEVVQKEVDYVNTLMDVYIQNGLDEKNQTSINAIRFIDEQLGFVTDSLKRAEDALQGFRLSNKSFNFSQEGNAVFERLTKLQTEKLEIKTQLNYYDYLQDYINKKNNQEKVVAPSIIGIADPLLNTLVDQLSNLSNERTLLSHRSSEDNRVIQNIDIQVETVMESLRENVKQLVVASNIALKDVNDRVNEMEQELLKLPITERQLLNIQREYNLNNETYNFLLKKRADAAISKASNVADNKVLDYAIAQNAVKIAPSTSKNKMLAIMLGLLIPLVLIFVIDFFNNTISDLQEIKTATTIPIVGTIGHNDKDSEMPVAENPASPLSESFRALRTNIHYLLREKSCKIINVTSTVSGEGKTFISTNLATIIAHSGKKVLLMGLDLRKPRMNKVFNINNQEGISTYLIGDTAYEDIIITTNIKNLYIAPSGPVPPNPAELIETPKMQELLEIASKEFDFIIIDTPPVAIVVDSLLLARFADANIFVVRQKYSSKDSILLANDLQKRDDIKGISLVVNDMSIGSTYGLGSYRYSYNYGYGYGSYNNNYYTSEREPRSLWKRIFNSKK